MKDAYTAAFAALMSFIEDQRNAARQVGIEPTEVWLGPEEYFAFDDAIRRNPLLSVPATSPCKAPSINSLIVRKSLTPGTRVGVSFPLETPTPGVRVSIRYADEPRASTKKGGGD